MVKITGIINAGMIWIAGLTCAAWMIWLFFLVRMVR